jgi:putative heme-binding domain-containing protein
VYTARHDPLDLHSGRRRNRRDSRRAAAQDRPTRGEQRPTRNPLEGNAQAISNGGAMFRTRCAGCHGPDARGYVGPDLTGVWLAGNTDDHLFDVVRRGIPGTEMTPADPLRVNDRDIWQVLAYLRTLSAVTSAPPTGDAANGERVFRANCTRCHVVNGRGGQLGPDLSRIGSGRPRAGLLSKLRGTSGTIRPGYESVTLVTKEGERIRGVRKNEDEFSIQIMDTRERLQGFLKANLNELTDGQAVADAGLRPGAAQRSGPRRPSAVPERPARIRGCASMTAMLVQKHS